MGRKKKEVEKPVISAVEKLMLAIKLATDVTNEVSRVSDRAFIHSLVMGGDLRMEMDVHLGRYTQVTCNINTACTKYVVSPMMSSGRETEVDIEELRRLDVACHNILKITQESEAGIQGFNRAMQAKEYDKGYAILAKGDSIVVESKDIEALIGPKHISYHSKEHDINTDSLNDISKFCKALREVEQL